MKKYEIEWKIAAPLGLSFLLFGGIYSFSAYLVGAFIAVMLLKQLVITKKSIHYKEQLYWGSVLMCISAVSGIFPAVDRGNAFLGFLRVLVFVLWQFYLMQFSENTRNQGLACLPWLGAGMVLLGILARFIPEMTDFFWQADRFGGFFQYSNTCALFLLINLLILTRETEPEYFHFFLFDLQLIGLFLTGSKGGILLLIPVGLLIFIKKQEFRKNIFWTCGILVATAAIYGWISGDYQNISRIFTLFQYQSTLLGRFLYLVDALPVLVTHPLGIGYMGYASMQPAIQTGVYTSLFVHNDWIQMGLDFGWIFLITAVIVMSRQLFKGKQESYKKWILGLICIYSLLEFHLQYLVIVMILPLLFDYQEEKRIVQKKGTVLENQILISFAAILFLYFGLSSFLGFTGNTKLSIAMYPYDTQILEKAMSVETDKDTAVDLAQKILRLNPYSSSSYNVFAYALLMEGDYQGALENKLRVLEIERFDMAEYADCEEMVSFVRQSDPSSEMSGLCDDILFRMEQLVRQTEETVSPIAYKLRDKPVFNWK